MAVCRMHKVVRMRAAATAAIRNAANSDEIVINGQIGVTRDTKGVNRLRNISGEILLHKTSFDLLSRLCHPNGHKLIQIAGHNRQKLGSLQQRGICILSFLKYTAVKFNPA